jgi:hypothetical protein
VSWPGDALHRDERRDTDFDAGTGRFGGQRAGGEPDRRRQFGAGRRRLRIVAQPVFDGVDGGPGLGRVGLHRSRAASTPSDVLRSSTRDTVNKP